MSSEPIIVGINVFIGYNMTRFPNWKTSNLKPHISNMMGKKGVFKEEKKVFVDFKSTEKAYIYSVLKDKFGDKLELEWRGIPGRRYRYDYAIPSISLCIEYNGIMSEKSRHTSITGYSKDLEKINLSQLNGWTILQYSPLTYKTITSDIEQFLKRK